ncbi:hypothetical protein QJS10_CPB12g00243 [Acorus calamus]|uniref:Nuclear matrix constituent protein 1-like protein n=1 Tax=Acorus calamus TaxID=4465 RepID=A0AAV9DNM2_ACOCL|nr:hypothetical protein QJS10_CPB12g00243 [Acorus calamus]
MLTPSSKGWFSTPKSAAPANGGSGWFLSKGKGATSELPPPPPRDSLEANGGDGGGVSAEEARVRRRFQEVGMLDPASMDRKDKEALVERVDSLERELYDYQYHMGLLLMEKKDLETKVQEFRQGLSEAEEQLQREKSAHVMVLSEGEKRVENMKMALGIEKQCVADLEKALHEMRTESAEVRVTSDRKLEEAQDLVVKNAQKSLEIDVKRRAADVKLAGANRKCSEIEMRIMEVEARERILLTERMSLKAERESDEAENSRRTEYLREWEKRLQVNQERLLEGERLLNQREERSNESDRFLKQKEKEFEESRKKFEESNNALKENEADIAKRSAALETKEKEIERVKEKFFSKERELLVLEEKLNAREKVEMQKLIDKHSAALEVKRHEFDVDMENRRKSLDEQLGEHRATLDQKEDELNLRDDKVAKRENALDTKEEKLKEEERSIESRRREIKKLDDSLKSREKDLKEEVNQLVIEKKQILISLEGLEKAKIEIENEKSSLLRAKENLQITVAERSGFDRLQLQLKDEIEENTMLKESLIKDGEDLKKERTNFEKEWEALDEKIASVAEEFKQLAEEKHRLERWHHDEEQKFRREKAEAEVELEQKVESIRLEKEAFIQNIEVERKKEAELGERMRADMSHEYAQMKHELEMDIKKRESEMLTHILEKKRAFEDEKEKELKNINYLRGMAAEEMQNVKTEQEKNEMDRRDLSLQRERIEEDQTDIKFDIERLLMLSQSLKEHREELNKERLRFHSQVEQHKICRNCGVIIASEAELFGLLPEEDLKFDVSQVEERMKGKLVSPQKPSIDMSPNGSSPPASGSRMSWLRKCKQIFSFSPGKRTENNVEDELDRRAASMVEAEDASQPSFGAASDSLDIPRFQSTETASSSLQAETEAMDRVHENDDEPQPSNDVETGASVNEDHQAQQKQNKSHQRTHSRAAALEDAKPPGDTERRGDANIVGQKRPHIHVSRGTASGDSEACRDSFTASGHHKRQETVFPARERPYNLQCATVAATHQGATVEVHQELLGRGKSKVSGDDDEGSSNPEQSSQPSLGVVSRDDGVIHLAQKSVVTTVLEIHESSSQKLVGIGGGSEKNSGDAEQNLNGVRGDLEEAEAMAFDIIEDGYETEEGSSDDYVESEDSEKGNASIGKKIWKFLTA